jgi:SAM-dependent methyltransferase
MESASSAVPYKVPRRVRASVFGRDPEAYDRARLTYPKRVYEILAARCGLHRDAAVFEIGPGTGIATRELIRLGASPITLIEPDRRLARYLGDSFRTQQGSVRILIAPFGRVALPAGSFDLGVAASSFHWTSEGPALRKVARALRPGGWWAAWNNHHGDPYRSSPFHQALQPVYRELYRGHAGGVYNETSAAKDRKKRIAALKSVGKFDHVSREDIHWSVTLDTAQVKALWGTFSDTLVLPSAKRRWFLSEVERVVDERFDGEVEFPMLTPIYTARRI